MRLPRALVALAAPALLLTACATPLAPGEGADVVPGGAGEPTAIAAAGTVVGQGTVLQKDGEEPQLCLGAIAQSYPPQCGGPVVVGWEWPDDGMWESSSGVTWGAYAMSGTWDGVQFTVGDMVIPLALYDPMKQDPDPRTLPENAAENSDELLTRVQDELSAWTEVPVLMSYTENGYVWATVSYDDGTIQAYLDEIYGPDVVAVVSALRDVPTS